MKTHIKKIILHGFKWNLNKRLRLVLDNVVIYNFEDISKLIKLENASDTINFFFFYKCIKTFIETGTKYNVYKNYFS